MLLNWINGVFGENRYLIFPGNYLSSEVKHNGVIAAAQEKCVMYLIQITYSSAYVVN